MKLMNNEEEILLQYTFNMVDNGEIWSVCSLNEAAVNVFKIRIEKL